MVRNAAAPEPLFRGSNQLTYDRSHVGRIRRLYGIKDAYFRLPEYPESKYSSSPPRPLRVRRTYTFAYVYTRITKLFGNAIFMSDQG